MLKALTSAALILVFAGSLLAGSPAGAHERAAGMGGMDGMDCCEKAQVATDAPDVQAARLCCAVNCPQPGPVQPTGQVRPQTPPGATLVERPAAAQSHFAGLKPPAFTQAAREQVSNSPPSYIRHLSLLI